MKIVKVNASKKYEITVTNGFEAFKQRVLPLILGDKVAIITDSNVEKLYYNQVTSLLEDKSVYKLVIPAGEQNKNAEQYINLINKLAEYGFSRKDTVITLGGGVVGDLGAFVASTYMRGINLIAIPTTLLSMVDSSVGGKTGIDLEYGKNLCGTFYQPNAVYINVDCLSTLPEREVVCGKGEIMKYAFIDGRITPCDLVNINYQEIIIKALEIKRDIVEEDEKESGKRMLLNFGHTVGHAIEKLKNFTLSHGECVIKGMYSAISVAEKLGLAEESFVNKATEFLLSSGVKPEQELSKEQIVSALKNDKKSDGSCVNFVLATAFGKPLIKKLEISTLKELI